MEKKKSSDVLFKLYIGDSCGLSCLKYVKKIWDAVADPEGRRVLATPPPPVLL